MVVAYENIAPIESPCFQAAKKIFGVHGKIHITWIIKNPKVIIDLW